MFAELKKTANGEIPENPLLFKGAEGARGQNLESLRQKDGT